MQHWLKDISSSSDPFSETFENMLRKSSVKQPDGKPVAVTVASKEAREEADHGNSQSPAQARRQSAEVPSSSSDAEEKQSFTQAGHTLQVRRVISLIPSNAKTHSVH